MYMLHFTMYVLLKSSICICSAIVLLLVIFRYMSYPKGQSCYITPPGFHPCNVVRTYCLLL